MALNPSRWISTKFPETLLWQPLDEPVLQLLPVLGHTALDPSQLDWEWDRGGRRVTCSSSHLIRPWSEGSPPSFCVVPLVTFLLPCFCAPPSSASARAVCGAANPAVSSQGDLVNAPYDLPVRMKTKLNRRRSRPLDFLRLTCRPLVSLWPKAPSVTLTESLPSLLRAAQLRERSIPPPVYSHRYRLPIRPRSQPLCLLHCP